jgi:glucuronate isomerase
MCGLMKQFMDDDFLLENDSAVRLYHEYAKTMPIIDYHCHLDAKEIFENKQFKNITEAWLYGDHYKWLAMRSNGIDERLITGDANDYDKFLAWAQTLEKCIGNPLYHWTHLELQRFFGIYGPLTVQNAPAVWEKINSLLGLKEYSARSMISKSNVKVICTTDDPVDSLEYHRKIREDATIAVQVLPTFRPDKGQELGSSEFIPWVEQLGKVTGCHITTYGEFLAALERRMQFFHDMGCRSADHGLQRVPYLESSQEIIAEIFQRALQGGNISEHDVECYQTAFLQFCGRKYAQLGWIMQLHIGPMRNNNSRMFRCVGPNSGFDAMNDCSMAYSLAKLLDSLERDKCLPKTILYAINPKDYYVLGTVMGNFQTGNVPGKIQFGTAWWFNDNKKGMIEQMSVLSSVGLISHFVGMVTDSRSFLSYTRHEYFRRILCNLFGEWVESGEVPADWDMIGGIIQDICFNNVKKYFGFQMR